MSDYERIVSKYAKYCYKVGKITFWKDDTPKYVIDACEDEALALQTKRCNAPVKE